MVTRVHDDDDGGVYRNDDRENIFKSAWQGGDCGMELYFILW